MTRDRDPFRIVIPQAGVEMPPLDGLAQPPGLRSPD
jgi:hypothetical protein